VAGLAAPLGACGAPPRARKPSHARLSHHARAARHRALRAHTARARARPLLRCVARVACAGVCAGAWLAVTGVLGGIIAKRMAAPSEQTGRIHAAVVIDNGSGAPHAAAAARRGAAALPR
jgi:hypothetical protein